MSTNKDHHDFCHRCGKTGHFKKCAQCKIAKYCGADCQKADWPVHKAICGTFTGKCKFCGQTNNFELPSVILAHKDKEGVLVKSPIFTCCLNKELEQTYCIMCRKHAKLAHWATRSSDKMMRVMFATCSDSCKLGFDLALTWKLREQSLRIHTKKKEI
jgi:hypothetical protein